ncbi:adenylate kinase [Nematocida sp. AWRm80]|nr:adenylate kinase [Nematocida sp. AWRm80]
MGPRILITGTPGVGKTTLSKYIGKITGYKILSLSDIIAKKHLYSNKCNMYNTLEYSPGKVMKYLKKKTNDGKGYIIDTHDPESVSQIEIDVIIVLSADTKVLQQRYLERGYNQSKIDVNIQVEIMEVPYNDAIEYVCRTEEQVKDIIRVETTEKKQPKEVEAIYKEISSYPIWNTVLPEETPSAINGSSE